MYHSGEHKVVGPGDWFGEHEEGSLAPQIFCPENLVNPFFSLQKGLSAYAHPLSKNLFGKYNLELTAGQVILMKPVQQIP